MSHPPGVTYRCYNDLNRTMEFVSEGIFNLTGYLQSELIVDGSITYWEIIHPEDREYVLNIIQEAVENKKPYELEYRIITSKGELKWVEENGNGIYDNCTKELSFLEGIIIDISDRKRSEFDSYLLKKILKSLQETVNFNRIIEITLNQICEITEWDFGEAWIPNSQTEKLEYSQSWYSRFESREKFTQFRQEAKNYFYTLGKGAPGKVWLSREAMWVADIPEKTNCIRYQITQKYGLKSGFFVPIISQDKVVTVLGFFSLKPRKQDKYLQDLITTVANQIGRIIGQKQVEIALKESQRQMSSLINTVPGIFFRSRKKQKWSMTYLSEGCFELTNYSVEELINESSLDFDDIIHPQDLSKVLQTRETTLNTEEDYVIEYRIKTKNNQEKWVWEKGHGHFDGSGNLLELEGFITDISDRKIIEEKLRNTAAELEALFAGMKDIIVIVDKNGKYLKIAPTNPSLLCQKAEDLIGKTIHELLDKPTADRFLANIQTALNTKTTTKIEYSIELNQKLVWFVANISPIDDDSVIWVARDITDRKEYEEKLQETEKKYRSIFENALEGIFQSTPSGYYLNVNPALAKIYGYKSSRELMETITDIANQLYVDKNRRADFIAILNREGVVSNFESQVYRKDGSIIWIVENARAVCDSMGKCIYYEGTVEDISYRIEVQRKLHAQAFYDTLTGLANRALLMKRLGNALERLKQNGDRFAVLFLDLDRFKIVNDSLGHLVGDRLLIEIANRLKKTTRKEDLVARLGGDEFTILLENINDINQAIVVAKRIKEELSGAFNLNGYKVFTGASIGIFISDNLQETRIKTIAPEDVLRDADTALYRAKANNKGSYQIFEPEMHLNALAQLQLETDIRNALEEKELMVFYQPIICLESRKIVGLEALLRWQHRNKGLVSPDEFIATAEETGLIIPIGLWVLREACYQLKEWQDKFGEDLFISVNLSVKQFNYPSLIEEIDLVLAETGLNPHNLRLEITESCWLKNESWATKQLIEFNKRNIQLCIDDFGTGYSSLSYLHQFPIQALKIDCSFICEIDTDSAKAKIARAIFSLASELGLEAIAEGIESEQQAKILKETGCQFGQGYFFAKPLSSNALNNWISRLLSGSCG